MLHDLPDLFPTNEDHGAAEHAASLDHLMVQDAPPPNHLVAGGAFVLDTPTDIAPRWGTPSQVVWQRGESLMIVAPPGVGKTTMAVQLVEALIGVGDGNVLGLPVERAQRVLYLAMDRPRQIARAMTRRFGPEHRAELDQHLVVHRGPLPTDLAKVPDQLVTLAQRAGADVVVVDSLKDACAKLTDDESGSMVNRAIQYANAADIDVLVLHHQRKGQAGAKPTSLADVYGSTWLTAGAGSVVLLWGEAGSEQVELSHLKQPADPVGPWTVEHDHHTGRSVVTRGFDALAFLARHPGCTIADAAQAEHGAPQKAGSAPFKRTERRFRKLVIDGLAKVTGGGVGTFTAAHYYPTPTMDTPHRHEEVTP
ncbi:MAG TPA: AAA family ATPase [Ilumatobacteraceae bacterium]|nr:AAA family ATPase [Ilumatobacteraceae bacterium]HRB03097.1 AAA family ATPase [Ilumatobacteraceae bacterium]